MRAQSVSFSVRRSHLDSRNFRPLGPLGPLGAFLSLGLSLVLLGCGADPAVERTNFEADPRLAPAAAEGDKTHLERQSTSDEREGVKNREDEEAFSGPASGFDSKGNAAVDSPLVVQGSSELTAFKPCVADKGSVCGPFRWELVSACLKFSPKTVEGRAACVSDRWSRTYHAQLEVHLAGTAKSNAANEAAFAKVIAHVMHWEGGCSNHPADRAGRSFKGITAATARSFGFRDDVCSMPLNVVLAIHHDLSWEPRARQYGWPLNLAIMNTEVASGGARAKVFVDRMRTQKSSSSLVEKARWFLDQQTALYRSIVANDASQKVFLAGWLSRSDYMHALVLGKVRAEPQLSLSTDESAEVIPAAGKAY
jgi:hypothetical protein